MYSLERDGRDVDQVYVAVHAAVETEVAEVGRHSVEIAGVVAEYGYRDWGLLGWEKVGDVDYEFVVAAYVLAGKLFSDVYGGLLACAFKVQQRAAIGVGIVDGNMGAIPAVAAIVRRVRVAGVVGAKAMRQCDGLPCG